MHASTRFIAGLLSSAFSLTAQPALAQPDDLAHFGPGSKRMPFPDINILVQDIYAYKYVPHAHDPGVYHYARVFCNANPARIEMLQFTAEAVRDSIKDELYGPQHMSRGATQYVLGTDGKAHDLKQPQIYQDFMTGKIETGVKPDTIPFLKAVRKAAETCRLEF